MIFIRFVMSSVLKVCNFFMNGRGGVWCNFNHKAESVYLLVSKLTDALAKALLYSFDKENPGLGKCHSHIKKLMN